MPSVGENLRRARLAQGLDLKQVALQTKISQRYLEAIEADDRASLPAGFFYKNWVRQYASMLGLDADALTAEVDHIVAGDAPPALPGQERMKLPKELRPAALQLPGARIAWHRGVYSVAALFVVVLGCSALYAWWRNAQVHASPATVTAEKGPAPVQTQPATQSQAQTPPPVQATPTSTIAVAPPVDQEAVPALPSVTDMVPSSTPQQPDRAVVPPAPIAAGEVQIELAATQVTWISISPDGKQTFAGVLQPAEIKTVAAHETARIRFGNAGGVNVRLNGKAIGPIGPNGQVRTLVIDKSGFKILEPAPPPPPAPAITQPSPTLDERSPGSALN